METINVNNTNNTNNETVIANPESEYDADFYTKKALELFDNLGVEGDYTYDGVKANIDDWLINKKPLFNLLRKHPNWNEEAKAIIVPSYQETRESDSGTKRHLLAQIVDLIDRDVYRSFILKTAVTPYDLILTFCENQFIEEYNNGIVDRFNAFLSKWDEKLHVHEGQKSSRVINKILKSLGADKHPDYNRLYAKLADAYNPLIVTKTSILSANWLDFLTMSNGNSWSSCHDITPSAMYSGCYKAGCLSYANDKVTLIFYTIGEDSCTKDFFAEPKITRQIFFYDYPALVQERLYPQCNDTDDGKSANSVVKQYHSLIESIIASCENKPNLWEKTSVNITANNNTFMYHDWSNFNNWVYKFKDEPIESNIEVGADCYCLSCGEKKYYDEETLYCEDCNKTTYTCDNCGWTTDSEDNLYYCEDNGLWLCEDCCTYCDYHERYESNDNDFVDVENYGRVCTDALDSGNFDYCDHCDRYFYNYYTATSEVDGEYWCEDCIKEDAVYCEECEQYYNAQYTSTYYNKVTRTTVCSNCADLETCPECGCVDLTDNMTETSDGEWYCKDCFSKLSLDEVSEISNDNGNNE